MYGGEVLETVPYSPYFPHGFPVELQWFLFPPQQSAHLPWLQCLPLTAQQDTAQQEPACRSSTFLVTLFNPPAFADEL